MRAAARILARVTAGLFASFAIQAWASVSVSMTAPSNGSIYTAGSNITLSANASAGQGYTMSKVEFFHGTTLIGTDTSAPYSVVWNSVPSGSYSLTAKATAIKKNSPDETATSTAVNISVNTPPVVNLTSPTAEEEFPHPATITLSATASDSDGTIARVEFYIFGSLGESELLTVTTPPYTVVWQASPVIGFPYIYQINAMAVDNLGTASWTEVIQIYITENTPPTVSLTNPSANATLTAPASITLTAEAADSDGVVASVEFYHGSTLITTLNSAPYTFNWTGVPQGSYSLTAKAIDNSGAATTSSPVNVTVNPAVAQLHFVHVDHLNTPRLVANQSGQAVWRWDQQEPFGVNVPDENPSGLGVFDLPLRLPGQYFDKETNLHYNYFRDYDPSIGRYVQSDPIGLKSNNLSTYIYAASNPLWYLDPSGLVNWKGNFGGAGYAKGAGGALFVFDITSECKCNQRVRIIGYASGLTVGIAYRPGSITGGSTQFYDYRDCPDPEIANGLFTMASAGFVIGTGPSYARIRLGELRSYGDFDERGYGYDVSIGLYLGASTVTSATIECCE